ncbi:hypothetical protein BGZ52_004569 [Haplosporangium bisporale]|nr:hypothetical protein BGZ52_004569 [Haplosporangium bisporale]KAF9215760.1 hypothetical protein BGZ59_000349 [Podila verticillata]
MYRRRIKKPRAPVFGKSLEEFGFKINANGRVVDLSPDDAVLRVVRDELAKDYGFVEMAVPLGIDKDDTTTPRAQILATENIYECERVLVLIPGTRESLGSWSRRLICNASVVVGSMKSTVKLAHEGGYGVLILNPNAHHWVNNEATSQKIFFMAHKYGTHTLMRTLSLQFEAFKDRVSAISLVDGSHSIDSYIDPSFRKWWSLNAAGYAPSEAEDLAKVDYKPESGCNNYMTGTQEFDHTLIEAIPLTFEFFGARKERDTVFDHYKDTAPVFNEVDPTTFALAIHDDGDEKDDHVGDIDPASVHASW